MGSILLQFLIKMRFMRWVTFVACSWNPFVSWIWEKRQFCCKLFDTSQLAWPWQWSNLYVLFPLVDLTLTFSWMQKCCQHCCFYQCHFFAPTFKWNTKHHKLLLSQTSSIQQKTLSLWYCLKETYCIDTASLINSRFQRALTLLLPTRLHFASLFPFLPILKPKRFCRLFRVVENVKFYKQASVRAQLQVSSLIPRLDHAIIDQALVRTRSDWPMASPTIFLIAYFLLFKHCRLPVFSVFVASSRNICSSKKPRIMYVHIKNSLVMPFSLQL